MLLKNLLGIAVIFALSFAPAVFAQSSANSYSSPDDKLSINESNLYCFQNLQCLIQENPFENSTLEEIDLNNSTEKYVIEGESENESLYAEYNGSTGNLIKSTVIQTNIKLPRAIMETLVSDTYKSWKMLGNKRIIKNFSEDSIRYEVILMKDGELRVEYFNRYGGSENPLS